MTRSRAAGRSNVIGASLTVGAGIDRPGRRSSRLARAYPASAGAAASVCLPQRQPARFSCLCSCVKIREGPVSGRRLHVLRARPSFFLRDPFLTAPSSPPPALQPFSPSAHLPLQIFRNDPHEYPFSTGLVSAHHARSPRHNSTGRPLFPVSHFPLPVSRVALLIRYVRLRYGQPNAPAAQTAARRSNIYQVRQSTSI